MKRRISVETNNQQKIFKPSKKKLLFGRTRCQLFKPQHEVVGTPQHRAAQEEEEGEGGGGRGRSGGLKLELFPTKRHVGAKQAATCFAAKSELEKANFGGRVAKKSKGGSTQGP